MRKQLPEKKNQIPTISLFVGFLFAGLVSRTFCHSHGVTSCSSPIHRTLPSLADEAEVRASIRGSTIVISSSKKFRGFLFVADGGLIFTEAPVHGEISDICYKTPGRAVSHTSAMDRDEIVVGFSCTPGAKVSVNGYVVYKYSTPFVNVGGSFTCPDIPTDTPSVLDTTPEPPKPDETSTNSV